MIQLLQMSVWHVIVLLFVISQIRVPISIGSLIVIAQEKMHNYVLFFYQYNTIY